MRQRIYSTKNDNNRFKIARVRVGLTQLEVSKILNIVPSTISKWEAGIAIPDQAILTKVADLYQTSVDELLGRSVRAPLPYPSEPIINMPIIGSVRAGMDGNIISDAKRRVTRTRIDCSVGFLGDFLPTATIKKPPLFEGVLS